MLEAVMLLPCKRPTAIVNGQLQLCHHHFTARHYETWAAYVAMERSLRALTQARGVYRRAWSRKLEAGGQLALCYDWLRFEREEGRWALPGNRQALSRVEGFRLGLGPQRSRQAPALPRETT
jgi:hypothetical protein